MVEHDHGPLIPQGTFDFQTGILLVRRGRGAETADELLADGVEDVAGVGALLQADEGGALEALPAIGEPEAETETETVTG